MGIDDHESGRDLDPRLQGRPFFEGVTHCESWIDRALLEIEIEGKFSGVDPKLLEEAKVDLEYAKSLLQPEVELPDQDDVDARFFPLIDNIMSNEEAWGDLGAIYAEVSNFISMEMTKD